MATFDRGRQASAGLPPLTASGGNQQSLENIIGAALLGQDLRTATTPLAGPQAEVQQTAGLFDFISDLLAPRDRLNEALQTPPGGRKKKPPSKKAVNAFELRPNETEDEFLNRTKRFKKKGETDREFLDRTFEFNKGQFRIPRAAPPPDQQAALEGIFGGFLG